jgi:DNA-directed RNA polymerase specialized sigma24 family protein
MSYSSVFSKGRSRSAEQAVEVRAMASQIYAARRAPLLRVAERNSACAADAEEALQDAFLAFIESYDPGGEAPPLAWLTLVLKRRCWRIKEARRHETRELLPGAESEARRWAGSPPDPGATVVDLEEARMRLHGLKPDERTAIGLAAAGYSYNEISERRNWTRTKVNRCLYEGRSALREAGSTAG